MSYIIRNKATGEIWKTKKNKSLWSKPGYAKSAWLTAHQYDPIALNKLGIPTMAQFMKTSYVEFGARFDEQDLFEIVDLSVKEKIDRDKVYSEYVAWTKTLSDFVSTAVMVDKIIDIIENKPV